MASKEGSVSKAFRAVYGWLRAKPKFVGRLDEWSVDGDGGKTDPKGKSDAEPEASSTGERVEVTVGRRKTKVVVSEGEKAEADPEAKEDGAPTADPLGTGVLKVVGAAAAGIGAVSAIVAVGAAILWLRFDQAGIPAMQAISVQPKLEALAQGGQQTAIFVLVALLVVLLIFFTDPGGVIRRVTMIAFTAIFVAAVLYVLGTHLTDGRKVLLIALAAVLVLGCIIVGLRTDKRFWPLALAVFVGSLVFAATTGLLIVGQQQFVQGVAVLRGANDAGLTGLYVAAGEKTLYVAEKAPIPTDSETRMTMVDVPREGASYAVGPLESRAKAEQRARVMLVRLVEARERNSAAVAAPTSADDEGEDGGGDEAEEGAAVEGAAAEGESGADEEEEATTPPVDSAETVALAFADRILVEREVTRPKLCLVRYGDASAKVKVGRWWTSCPEAGRLTTIEDVRAKLALPNGRFQPSYDMKVEAEAPLGTKLLVLRGVAAPQCEHVPGPPCGHEYPGGGVQYYVPQPQSLSITGWECTTAREDESSAWEPCAP